MKAVTDFVAKLGENPDFVAFQAHAWFAFAVVHVAVTHLHLLAIVAILVSVSLAALKEFWFDATYETDPPQTARDDVLDFVGYLTGILVGALL